MENKTEEKCEGIEDSNVPQSETEESPVGEMSEIASEVTKCMEDLVISPSTSKCDDKLPEGSSPPKQVKQDNEVNSVYHLKRIIWHGRKTPIVTQNENGPCPLIAISNVLLLRGKIYLASMIEMVTAEQLVEYIGDAIISSIPKDLPEVRQLNYEQNMADAISVLPKLQTGLDVNVKFTGVTKFEYTPECIIFDLLNIPLYHGWVIDPQCADVVAAVGSLGYNQVVEKIINNKSAEEDELVTEALIAEQFLERTASQLTYHGLCELHAAMQHEELAVLFRNNHFSTILKRNVCIPTDEASSGLMGITQELDELFQLVTDQGFLHEPRVVWETLSNIDGDGMFVDGFFSTVPPKIPAASYEYNEGKPNYLVALSLEEEQKKLQEGERGWEDLKQEIASDEDLARRVQEEDRRHAHSPIAVGGMSHGHSRQYAHTGSGERNKKGSCDIL